MRISKVLITRWQTDFVFCYGNVPDAIYSSSVYNTFQAVFVPKKLIQKRKNFESKYYNVNVIEIVLLNAL